MRPSLIPDEIAKTWPGERIVIGPPKELGELDGPIAPVEAMLLHGQSCRMFAVRCVLEGDDLEKLQTGQAVWITFMGDVVPFLARVGP